jgi:hypothetical protein
MIFGSWILDTGIVGVGCAMRASHIESLRAEARARPLTDSEQAWLRGLESTCASAVDRTPTLAFGAVEQVRRHQSRLRKLSSPRER